MFLNKLLTVSTLLLISTFIYSQNNDALYSKKWKEIDSLIAEQNLTQTAIEKVNSLLNVAIEKKDAAQQIKCLVYRINLEETTSENDPTKSIGIVDSALQKTTDITVKSLLEGLIAFEYKTYFDNNRWHYYNRSNTINFKKEDLNTWTADDFNAAISQHYLLSIKAASVLQQTKLPLFNAIIIKGNSRELRPTLFDLLAHQALDYFKSSEAYVTKPTYAFIVDDNSALLPASDFVKTVFNSKDSISHQLIALQLFKQLIAFHQSQNNIQALIDVDLERIEWVHQNSAFGDKDVFYQQALNSIVTKYPHQKEALQAWYLLAKIEADKAETYKPFGDTTNRYGYVNAMKIIDKVLIDTSIKCEG